jgi:hypothetical protein
MAVCGLFSLRLLVYNAVMENEFVAVQNVKDLQDTGKQWLEKVLGHHLQESQQIYIMVFTPSVEPDATAKRQGRAAVQQVWNRVEANLHDSGATGAGFDEAVDEAMEHIRRRES